MLTLPLKNSLIHKLKIKKTDENKSSVTPIKDGLCAAYPLFSFQTPEPSPFRWKMFLSKRLACSHGVLTPVPKREKVSVLSFLFCIIPFRSASRFERKCLCRSRGNGATFVLHNQVSGLMSAARMVITPPPTGRGGFRRTQGGCCCATVCRPWLGG
jgi:hypothetical protein